MLLMRPVPLSRSRMTEIAGGAQEEKHSFGNFFQEDDLEASRGGNEHGAYNSRHPARRHDVPHARAGTLDNNNTLPSRYTRVFSLDDLLEDS